MRDIGWRSFMAAASDVAAMGAEAWCALAALALPDDVDDAALEELARGQREAATAIGARVVGGNLSRAERLGITTTLLGTCERATPRSGARPGDGIWIAGPLGLAAAGLRSLSTPPSFSSSPLLVNPLSAAVDAWRCPVARIADGRAMAAVAHACIDVSDGLALDLDRLARASGVAARLDERALLDANAATVAAASALGASPLDLVLHGGEDYALVCASDAPIAGFHRMGSFAAGEGVWLGGKRIEPQGFDHFAR
jgi:thiamine-monophosphate kinase